VAKPNTPGCNLSGGCCGEVTCVIFADSYDRPDSDDIGSGWNEFVGNALISGNVLSIDGSASDSRILTTLALASGLGLGKKVSVRLRAASGERIGVLFWDDVSNYMEATVRFSSSATGGRIDFKQVVAGVVTFSHNQEYECGNNEYEIPDGEWATLTLDIAQCGGFGNYAAKLTIETASQTYSIGWYWIPPLAGASLRVGLMTTGTPTLAEFDDFSVSNIEIGWPSCPAPMMCCSWEFEAITLGYAHTGWDYDPGVWEEDVVTCFACFYDPLDAGYFNYVERTYDSGAKQVVETPWVNSNVWLSVKVASACDGPGCTIGDLAGNQYRLILEDNPPNSWWVECESFPAITYPGLNLDWYWSAKLQHGGATEAYILFARDTPGSIGSYREPQIRLKCYDCQIEFGMVGIEVVYVFWSDTGGAIQGWAMLQTGFTICVDVSSIGVAGTGNVGFGAGNVNSNGAGFADFSAQCSTPFDCENTGHPFEPPDVEPDPFGCCADFEDLIPGLSIEVEVSGVTWTTGPWCVDGTGACASDFGAFMGAVNSTWVMTMYSRTATEMRFFAFLAGVYNPCEDCAGVDLGDITIPFQVAADLVITNNGDGTCTATMEIGLSSCASCVLPLTSGPFAEDALCDGTLTLFYAGGADVGLRSCCIAPTGNATLYLP
jgi:hypothetical protein